MFHRSYLSHKAWYCTSLRLECIEHSREQHIQRKTKSKDVKWRYDFQVIYIWRVFSQRQTQFHLKLSIIVDSLKVIGKDEGFTSHFDGFWVFSYNNLLKMIFFLTPMSLNDHFTSHNYIYTIFYPIQACWYFYEAFLNSN